MNFFRGKKVPDLFSPFHASDLALKKVNIQKPCPFLAPEKLKHETTLLDAINSLGQGLKKKKKKKIK